MSSEQQYKFATSCGFEKIVTYIEQGQKVTSKDYYGLCRGVSTIRHETGQGDLMPMWEQRLMSEVCRRHNLRGCKPVDDIDVRRIGLSDITSFYNSMKKWKALDGKTVPSGIAERRAAICVDCPKNVTITGCFGCANVLPAVLKLVKDVSTSHDEQLKGCAVCGCALKALVHMPLIIKDYNKETIKALPEHCWQRLEFEAK